MRVGLIGCGAWGLNYLRVVQSNPSCQMLRACDSDLQRRGIMQSVAPDLTTVDTADALLSSPAVDAVIVATPAASHYQIVKKVLLAGRHCLVEKPLTTRVEEGEELTKLAAARGLVLMVGHVFRFNAAVEFVRLALRDGVVGDLRYINCTRTNLGPIRSDVSCVWDLMTHDVSILYHLLDDSPISVSAQGAAFLRQGCYDVAFATLGYGSGVVANLRTSWIDPRKVREITIVGARKMLVIDDLDVAEPVRIYDKGAVKVPEPGSFGEYKMGTRTGDVVIPFVAISEPLQNQWRHFVTCVESGRQPLSDGTDGVRVVAVLDAIERSILAGGTPVTDVWSGALQRTL